MQETLKPFVAEPMHRRMVKKSSTRSLIRRLVPLLTPVVILATWQLVTMLELYPSFIIPAPAEVFATFVEVVEDGTLWKHTLVTLEEVLLGLLLGVGLGTTLGYLIAKVPILEDLLSPVIVVLQSTPNVAYAPLLIIWFGSGTTSKIFTAAIIVFFPILINTIVGIRNVPPNLRDLMLALRASRWQMLTKLEIAAAMPVLLAGLKTSATLAVIGAVVGEFVSPGRGLGSLVTLARNQYNTPLVIVAIITMAAMALSLYLVVTLLEQRLLNWQRRLGRNHSL